MIKADLKDIGKLVDALDRMGDKGVGFAQKNTVNTLAFNTRKVAIYDLDKNFTIRNKWTGRSILVEKARSIRNPEASVGSVQPYMELQELGGTQGPKKGAGNVTIPTGYASGEDGSKSKRKLPRGRNKLRNINLKKARPGKTRAQKNIIAISMARKSSNKYVYLHTSRTKGIFRVLGGKRKSRIKMVHDLRQKSIVIKKRPWLEPAVDKVIPSSERIYKRELLKQWVRAFK